MKEHASSLKASIWIALFFMFVEVAGGWVANSLALISDALHMFTDVGSLMLSLIVLRIVNKPSTATMTYGYHRAEILGALASALSLWGLALMLIYEGAHRIVYPEPVEGGVMFIIACVGLIANLWMLKLLHKHHTHNLNMRAAYLHVISDLLGSVGVILGGALLWYTNWSPIDPIITILFTLSILYSSGKVIKQSIKILMESAPEGIDPIAIQKDLQAIPGVKEVHDLHVWSVATNNFALSAHLVTDMPQDALQEAHRVIEKKYKISHMTIQVEDPAHFESKYCYDCSNGFSKEIAPPHNCKDH